MKSLVVWATFAATVLFAACEHGGPAPREMPRMAPRPMHVEPMPVPVTQPDNGAEPMSVKPDAGIQWDGGAPLPPIPDGGPLPQTRDASVPLQQTPSPVPL